MSTQTGITLAGAVLLIFLVIRAIQGAGAKRVRLTSKPLMTSIERETIGYIEAAVPHCRVHAQVAMGALLTPDRGLSRKEHQAERNRVSQKIIDFVLEERSTGKVLALVKLDDRTHNAGKDRERDMLTAAGGYLTIRLPKSERPTMANVRTRILDALSLAPLQ